MASAPAKKGGSDCGLCFVKRTVPIVTVIIFDCRVSMEEQRARQQAEVSQGPVYTAQFILYSV